MSWYEYPVALLAMALCGGGGFIAGAVLVIKGFLDLHNSALPPPMRPQSLFSRENLSGGVIVSLLYIAGVVLLIGIAASIWFAVGSYGDGRYDAGFAAAAGGLP